MPPRLIPSKPIVKLSDLPKETFYGAVEPDVTIGKSGDLYLLQDSNGYVVSSFVKDETDTWVNSGDVRTVSTYTPDITPFNGSITTIDNIVGRYTVIGNIIQAHIEFRVVDNGTGSTSLQVTLPVNTSINKQTGVGINFSEAFLVYGYIHIGGVGTAVNVKKYEGSYPLGGSPITSNQIIIFDITYIR